MKINWNNKYTTISMYSFIVISCSIIFFNILSQMNVFTGKLQELVTILQPFIVGGVIAYLLNFILEFYERKVLNNDKLKNIKSKRALSIIMTYITAGFICYLFAQFVVPQLVDSIVGLANNIPQYVTNLTLWIEDMSTKLNINQEYTDLFRTKWNEIVAFIVELGSNLIPLLTGLITSTLSGIWNIILGLIISIYLLIDKEKFYGLFRKSIYAGFNEKNAKYILKLARRSNNTFGNFLGGKILDSAIIGVLTFAILTVFKMPYTLLISVIIGITNIIPFFGPFFGAIPSAIIILFVSPIKALWFLVIILVIQQLDGNVIGPKILGDSIGISAFWILFSLLIAGKVLGLVGMIIGVPLFAIIYSVIKEVVESKLEKKGLPTDTSNYMKQ